MKPAFILYSIQHTGTHFVKQFLTKIGFQLFNARHFDEKSFVMKHVPWDDELLYQVPIITPLRNPMDCLESNLNRGHVLSPTKSDLRFMRFVNDWSFLMDISQKLNIQFIHINCGADERLNELTNAAKFIGFEFDKNVVKNYADKWVALHTSTPSNRLISEVDYSNIPLMEPIVEWYENIIS